MRRGKLVLASGVFQETVYVKLFNLYTHVGGGLFRLSATVHHNIPSCQSAKINAQ